MRPVRDDDVDMTAGCAATTLLFGMPVIIVAEGWLVTKIWGAADLGSVLGVTPNVRQAVAFGAAASAFWTFPTPMSDAPAGARAKHAFQRLLSLLVYLAAAWGTISLLGVLS